MSEILIKGMEMPKYCNKCPFEKSKKEKKEYIWFCSLTNTECENVFIHNKDCPLVEVPPHGRLGDLDLVEEWMRKKYKDNDCPFDIDAFLFELRKIPTVLEATISND